MMKNRRKMLAKQEVSKKKAGEKAVEKGKERHLNIQSKAVKKRMKKLAFVEFTNVFAHQVKLPYATGCVWSYCEQDKNINKNY